MFLGIRDIPFPAVTVAAPRHLGPPFRPVTDIFNTLEFDCIHLASKDK